MNRLIAMALAGALFSSGAYAALKVGDAAPGFTAQAALDGKTFNYSLADALKKGPVVVYFYPAAFTAGCNVQAHLFAVNHEKFAQAGASIVGVSLDGIEKLKKFSSDPNYCAAKFAVASDKEGSIAKSYDLRVTLGFSERTTFVVTPDGKIAATVGNLSPDANVEKALEEVRKLAPKR